MPNGYYIFFLENKSKHKGKSEKELHALASIEWKNMSPTTKAVYNQKAAKSKGDIKLNTHGIPLDIIENHRAQMEAFEIKETEEITNTITHAIELNNLPEEEFLIIDTNFYCTLADHSYVTCEVALVPFSLGKGVLEDETYYTLINVFSIPTGYSYEASKGSKDNGVPLPPLDEAPSDLLKIMAEMMAIIQKRPLYAMPKQVKQVRSFLNQLCSNAGEEDNFFRVYSLPKLFYNLRKGITKEGDIGLPTMALAQAVLDKDPFTYTRGIACEIHEEGELFYKCALSVCKRLIYVICDHCCQHVGIRLIPGVHVPKKAQIDGEITDPYRVKQEKNEPISYYKSSELPEELIKQEKWPTLSPSTSNSKPSTSAWGQRKPAVVSPPPESSSLGDNNWPSLSSGKKRGGK